MRRKLVAGNWKMHGALAQNAELLDAARSGWLRCRVSIADRRECYSRGH
jgi:triosephosphate isomerase